MEHKEILGIIAVVCTVAGILGYLRSVLRGQSKPHTITWLIWLIVMSISFLGQLKEGAGPGSWNTGFGVVMGGSIFLLALRKGETSISKFDWCCLILSGLSLALYCFSTKVIHSMILVTFTDGIGYLPTIRKSFNDPFGEALVPWTLFSISWIFSLLAIQNYSLETVLYPGAILIMNLVLIAVVVVNRRVTR